MTGKRERQNGVLERMCRETDHRRQVRVLSKMNAGNARRKAALIYRTYGTNEETDAGTLTDEKRVRNGVLERMCGKMMCENG